MALHYREASSVLAKLEARRGGIKSLVFQSDFTNKKLVYAVVAETMKYAQVLQVLLNMLYKQVGYVSSNDGGSDDNDIFAPPNKWLVRVMVYDLLFGSRKAIQGNGAMKLAILRHRTHLEQALTTHMNEVGVKKHTELLPERLRGKGGAKLPRYARVNTLKTTMQDALDAFDPIKRAQAKAERTRLWHAANGSSTSNAPLSTKKHKKKKKAPPKGQQDNNNGRNKVPVNIHQQQPTIDPHVRYLLRFPPGRDLHDHPLVESGALILQDKSSCFSAQVLADAFPAQHMNGIDMIDACAAPGNKTSHLATLLALRYSDGVRASSFSASSSSTSSSSSSAAVPTQASSSVFAFDKSVPRLAVLERRMKEAGADHIVHATLQSFLEVDPHDPRYAHVQGILLDPSCSGSGMASRLDHFMDGPGVGGGGTTAEEEDAQRRLTALSDFQKEALLHAFTFPNVTNVVYSTCSVHNEENEHVVLHALASEQTNPSSQTLGPMRLAPALTSWSRRGRSNVGPAPGEEGVLTQGLTKAQADCLVRVLPGEDETNGFFVALFHRGAGKKTKQNKKRKEKRKRKKQREAAEKKQKQKS